MSRYLKLPQFYIFHGYQTRKLMDPEGKKRQPPLFLSFPKTLIWITLYLHYYYYLLTNISKYSIV